ncbi:MAG: hypothetical protein ACMUJM_13870 [bacterium]
MKKIVMIFVIIFGFSSLAEAILYDRGGGLIYDSVLNITWLENANYVETSGYDNDLYGYDTDGKLSWNDAMTWADTLVYGGFDDWRLPSASEDPLLGFFQTSEMGHLYYAE